MQKLSFSAFRGVSDQSPVQKSEKFLSMPNMTELDSTACPRPNLLNLIQKTTVLIEDMNSMEANDHPNHHAEPLPVDRQELSPSDLAELREACAVLARQVSIAAQALEDSRNRREVNVKTKKGKSSAKHTAHPSTSKSESQGRSSRRRDDDTHELPRPPSKGHAPVGYVPVGPAMKLGNVASHISRLSTPGDPDPLALCRVPKSRCQVKPVHLDTRISPDLLGRPVTSTGVSRDHLASSLDNSRYTSQTATTLDQPSTRLSSWSSPANERKSSPGSNCMSEQISPNRLSTSAAGVAAKTWMMQELSHRQAHASDRRTIRPGSCGSTAYKTARTDRPASRAGTIKDTLRDYIRPRPSSDAVHSTARSETSLGRFDSRRGQESHGGGSNWWRGSGLGSGKSWNSFRNVKGSDAGGPPGMEGPLNLNRALPALPGLDQYRERKANATHVAQLMRPKSAAVPPTTGEVSLPEQTATGQHPIPDPALGETARIRHVEAVQRSMEDRMRHHTRMASATFGLSARPKEHAARKRAQTTGMPSSSLEQMQGSEAPKVFIFSDHHPNERQRGFRNRLSRFLRRGGGKGDGR